MKKQENLHPYDDKYLNDLYREFSTRDYQETCQMLIASVNMALVNLRSRDRARGVTEAVELLEAAEEWYDRMLRARNPVYNGFVWDE